jgi:hypothetical protein
VKKISDNPSVQEVQAQIKGLKALKNVLGFVPFADRMFPGLDEVFKSFDDFEERSKLFQVPDQFNEQFCEYGWIAYESMNLDAMIRSLAIAKESGVQAAEEFLAETYTGDALTFGILRCNGHSDFRKRVRLLELAKDDYLADRYHACIPLLLALIDGLANDVSKHVGFFAEGANLTAWDSIAAHETGLAALAKTIGLGRNKTNEEKITVPYRNGILHGRELAFDNKIAAAKCWAALFALRDWAAGLANEKSEPKPKDEVSWSQLLQQVAETEKMKQAMENWKPRRTADLAHIPSMGPAVVLPERTPEKFVAEFLDNWCRRRYGPMADALLDFLNKPQGKKAGQAKRDFGDHPLLAYQIVVVIDEAAAVSVVEVMLTVGDARSQKVVPVKVRVTYVDANNEPAVWGHQLGCWKIIQNGFSNVIYRT